MGVKPNLDVWTPLLAEHRLASLPHDTVIEGRLHSHLNPDSPEVVEALETWSARAYLSEEEEGTSVVLVYQLKNVAARKWGRHLALFFVTLITTLGSGALMQGVDPFATRTLELFGTSFPYPSTISLSDLWVGVSFSFPFVALLLLHEMGHFVAASRHGVRASLPYFIPFPPYYSVIGSLGAFIRLRGPTVRRSVLFDIGASGPFASFIVSLPLFVVGLSLSEVAPTWGGSSTPFVIFFVGQPVFLGSSLLTSGAASLAGFDLAGTAIHLHPIALAGWLGLFVTALNLLPMGQLDGGHVLFALAPEKHAFLARLFLFALVFMGLAWWGWLGWAGLVWVLHRGKVGHPPVLQPGVDPGRLRKGLGWFLFVVFLTSFVLVPISL